MRYIVILLLFITGCNNSQCIQKFEKLENKTNDDTEKSLFKQYRGMYMRNWGNYSVTNKNLKSIISNFIGTKYRIIWKGDINADKTTDYFVVKEYSSIYKGVIAGMLISENCTIYLKFNTIKGVWNTSSDIINFNEFGLQKSDVKAFRLLLDDSPDSGINFSKQQLRNFVKKGWGANRPGFFILQIIDSKNNIIAYHHEISYLMKLIDGFTLFINSHIQNMRVKKTEIGLFSHLSELEYKNNFKTKLNIWRNLKIKGKTIKIINCIP